MGKKKCKMCDKPRTTGKFCSKECRQKNQEIQMRSDLGDRYEEVIHRKQARAIDETKTYPCDRCGESMPAWYTKSLLTKGLWVKCKNCGTHAAPFVGGLDLPERPSIHYLKNEGKMPSLIKSPKELGSRQKFIPKVITEKVIVPNYNKEEIMKTRGKNLTPEQKIAILKRNKHIKYLSRQGFTHNQIGKHYGLSKNTVKGIVES